MRNYTKTTGSTEEDSCGIKVGVSLGVIQCAGRYGKKKIGEESIEQSYDSYHHLIIELLNDLKMEQLCALPDECTGKLVLLRSKVIIRDIDTMKPLLAKCMSGPKNVQTPNDEASLKQLEMRNSIVQNSPNSITVSLCFQGKRINGPLIDFGLTIRQEDLMRNYGVNLPDYWYTLGILDKVNHTPPAFQGRTVDDLIDSMANSVSILSSHSSYKIIPLLIFRAVKK